MADTIAALPQDYVDLLCDLHDADAEFLLVGGWAVILYGHVRATDDMNIFVRPTAENAARVYAALERFGASLSAHALTAHHFTAEGSAYRFGVAPLKVEVLMKISGVTFDEAFVGAQRLDVAGRAISYIGHAALVQNKRAAGRYKDLADVEALESQHRT